MNGDRFRVMLVRDAVAAGYLDEWFLKWNEWNYALLDFKSEKPEVIHIDGGEPEDNNFSRDWSWIAPLLNKLAAGEA